MFVYLIGSTASVINYQLVGNRWRVRLCNKWPCIVTRVWSPLHTLAQIPHKSITSHICLLQNTLKKNAYWHRLSTNHSHLYRSHKMFSDQGQIRIERLFLLGFFYWEVSVGGFYNYSPLAVPCALSTWLPCAADVGCCRRTDTYSNKNALEISDSMKIVVLDSG